MGGAASKKPTRTPVSACILSGWAVDIVVKGGGGVDIAREVTSTMSSNERLRVLRKLATSVSARIFAPRDVGQNDSSVLVSASIVGDYAGELAPEIKEALENGWVGFEGDMTPLTPMRTLAITVHTSAPGATDTLVASVGALLSLSIFTAGGVRSSLTVHESTGMGSVSVGYGPSDFHVEDQPAGCGVHAK